MTSPRTPSGLPGAGSPGAGGGDPDECPGASAAAAVAGLAREVEAMRRAMKRVPTTGDLARVQRLVTEFGDTVAAHATAAAGTSARDEAEQVPSWLCAPGEPGHVSVVLTDLTRWLDDIYLRYADAARTMPECWLWHPEVVEELLWLMYAWLAAYQADDASIRAAGDWHDRLRPGVVRRVGDYTKGCSLENHLPQRATPPARVPLASAAEAITAWWSDPDARREPAPEPTTEQLDEALAASNRARPGGDRV